MAENLGRIFYEVDIETGQIVNAQTTVVKSIDKMERGMDGLEKKAQSTGNELSKLAKAVAGVIAAGALRDMAQLVQSYQSMAERVRMAATSQEEYELVQRRLLDTANGTYRALSEAQELYIRTAASLRSLGYSTEQALDVTDSMSYAFVKNETSVQRADAALNAFSKSLNTNKVAVDSWESITQAIPSVIEDIAAASGRSAAEVRALGAAGKLTARDLTEGLRKSLEANAKAAAEMSNNLTDAGVRSRNALQQILVSLEQQTGALQAFTNGIIMAADAVLEFGQDAQGMASLLQLVEGAALSLAAVFAGRLLTAIGTSAVALYAKTIGAGVAARADLAAAQAAAALAAQELIQAAAAERAAVGLSTHAAAAARLTQAQATATAATATLTAAQATAARGMGIATLAATGLRTAMAFLGGPVGVVLLAAAALYSFATAGREAKPPTDDLTKSVNELSQAQRNLAAFEAKRALQELGDQADRLGKDIAGAEKLISSGLVSSTDRYGEALERRRVELEKTQAEMAKYRQRLDDLNNYKPPPAAAAGAPGEPAAPTTSADGQKRLQEMRDEIELLKLTGEARARLQAIQRLGAEATPQERKEAEELASTIFRLEEAQKKAGASRKALTAEQKEGKEAAEELKRAQESDVETLADLREELYQTTLTAEQLRDRKAELSLSKYATPEQIAEVKALNAELARAAELEKRREAFSTDPIAEIRGDVSPLSGGKFDDQTARYEAEAKAEQQRYLDQQTRLEEALELQLVTKEQYNTLEEEMAQVHADRLLQIDRARQEMQLTEWAQGFGQMSSNLAAFAEEFASENKAMFAASKAAAIAQAIINTYQAATGAMAAMSAIPIVGPALGIAAAAAAVAGGLAQVSAIRSQSIGARQYGGNVDAARPYRVNENGAPEILNAANGHQYLLPNTRGEVVSNADATRGGDGPVARPVTVNQTIQVVGQVDNRTSRQIATDTARQQQITQARFGK